MWLFCYLVLAILVGKPAGFLLGNIVIGIYEDEALILLQVFTIIMIITFLPLLISEAYKVTNQIQLVILLVFLSYVAAIPVAMWQKEYLRELKS